MKRIFIVLFLIFFANNYTFAFNNIYSSEYSKQYQNFILQKERFNAINYNALRLTPEQIDIYEDITEQYENSYKKKINEITHQTEKLQIMKDCDLPPFEIKQQKKHIKKLYKELSKISQSEKKQLNKILNKEQRKTNNTLKHLERHDIKKELNPENYYKLNPKMSVFGNLQE
jgi:predicted nuclease with TOPRIM domain